MTELSTSSGWARPWLVLTMIVLAAVCLRAGRCGVGEHSWITKDSVSYVEMAQAWSAHGLVGAFDRNPRLPPLYLGLMAAGERFGLGAEFTGILVSVLAGAMLSLAVFFLARSVLVDDRVALLAAALAAAHPILLRNSAELMRDSLFLALFTTALALAVTAMTARQAWWRWLLVGAVAALATLTRDEGGEFLVILAVWGGWECWRNQTAGWARTSRTVGSVVLAFATYGLILMVAWRGLAGSGSGWQPVPSRLMSCVRTVQDLMPWLPGTNGGNRK